jgi:hypothetical protein
MTNSIFAIAIDSKGDRVWSEDVSLSTSIGNKGNGFLSAFHEDQLVLTWEDYTPSESLVKGQNFHTDGTLGNNTSAIEDTELTNGSLMYSYNNNIVLKQGDKISQVLLLNITGQIVKTFRGNTNEIVLPDLPQGIYLALAIDFSGQVIDKIKIRIQE